MEEGKTNTIDYTDQIINGVKVLRLDFQKSTPKNRYWVCICACGKEFSARAYDLRVSAKKCKSCTQAALKELHESRRIDMKGQVFGWLRVVDIEEDNNEGRGTLWKCECRCGNKIIAAGTKLRRGNLKSCGCMRIEQATNLKKSHGASSEPWYSNWRGMVYRTTNPNSSSYKRYETVIQYGEKIEEDFIKDPWAFFEEIGEKTNPEYSIDRIDNSRGYVRGNIRWADARTQFLNRNIIKRSEAESKLIDLANQASSKEELLSLLETNLDDTTFHSLSLP